MATVIRRFISYTHSTLVDKYCQEQEARDPRIVQAAIQRTELHQSHKDPIDPKKVISIQLLDKNGNRVGTGHLHDDGTSKFRYKQKPPSESPSSGFE
ncbi:uncharacterized protein BO66DRAFT_437383 [Aspergillus aculeatinus CBS 121060]|uniref:Uncharacterized protein n=1 Tax=Aspergillus aculeatinus CBS 121060 TaxID=1448322 RepID=A0ACD1HC65_9EURO|nr:hypothetical protein BO66DRAFT_437383 [Aspergillus aculeatinus CBS 121060]RAH71361.1 hypothetical protein BO66DRAFT_437383 [Aspergillus aculeatinus CBS 121060]